MSWINSNATYKQNSKNDLSFYHGFSKTPVEPTSTGTAATTLANASTKGGHTVIGTEVWAEEIPWFGLVASRAAAVTRLSGLTKLNDLVKVDGEGGKVYKYIGADDATFTEDTWADFWQEVTLTNSMELNNRYNQPVLRYYLNQPMQTLTTTNNASIDSKGFATRLFVNEENHTGQTSGGSVVSQFAAGTDNIKNGIPSVELNPKLYLGTTEKIAGTHYYDYNVSGTILWSTAVTSSSPKISCFRYIGKTVTGQLSTVDTTVKSHSLDIADIKLALGMNTNPDSPSTSVTARVETVEDVVRTLLGLDSDATIAATESIATTAANAVSTSLTGTTEGTIGKAIADAKQEALDAINAIQHFSVVVVPEGQTMENVTPVENTIYLVSDSQAADGSYTEYIAFKQGEEIKVERIGTTKLDLSGYTTDAEHEALQGRVSTTEGQIATITSTDTTKEGSIAKALADAKTYAEGQASAAQSGAEQTAADALSAARTQITAEIAQAKSEAIASAEVTITAGTGIVVTGEGKGTTFQIAVSDDVATTAALSALSQTVASNKTELEGKITTAETAASTALETAKTEIKGTTDALDTRLQTAEGKITALTEGESSVDSKIAAAQTTLQGNIDGVSNRVTELETVTVPTAAKVAQDAMTEAQAKVASVTGPATGLVTVTGDKEVIITVSDTIATKDYADTAATNAVTTGLATDGNIAQAIATAKSGAEQTAATALSTARGEITTEISTAVSDLETKLTTGEGSLGAKVAALETATETTLPAAIEQALTDAKAYSDSLHTTSLDYVVLGDSESLPTASAETLGKIYLVASQNVPTTDGSAISGSYVEYMTRKVSETEYTWEKIGTTETDLSAYAKTSEVEAAIAVVQGEVDTLEETHATDKAALEASIATKVGDVQWFGENDLISSKAEIVDGVLKISEQEISCEEGTHPWDYNSSYKSVTTVKNNEAFQADGTKYATIETNKIKKGNGLFYDCTDLTSFDSDLSSLTEGKSMFYNTNLSEWCQDLPILKNGSFMFGCDNSDLKTFIGDLSSLTNGNSMFATSSPNAGAIETFIGDLSSLTMGDGMFDGCCLNIDSVECIADTINDVNSLTVSNDVSKNISIRWTIGTIPVVDERPAFVAELSRIVDKGWTLHTNQDLLPLFDSEKYQTGIESVQPLDLDSEPQTIYYVKKK